MILLNSLIFKRKAVKKKVYSCMICVIENQFLKFLAAASFHTPKPGPIATKPNIAKQRQLVTRPDTPKVQPGPWGGEGGSGLSDSWLLETRWELIT